MLEKIQEKIGDEDFIKLIKEIKDLKHKNTDSDYFQGKNYGIETILKEMGADEFRQYIKKTEENEENKKEEKEHSVTMGVSQLTCPECGYDELEGNIEWDEEPRAIGQALCYIGRCPVCGEMFEHVHTREGVYHPDGGQYLMRY